MVIIPNTEPTQVKYPWKAAVRTALQVGIPAIVGLGVVAPIVIQIILDELGESLPEGWSLWLLGAAGVITAVSTALARIMAIPQVNIWLTKIGLGAKPAA